MGDGDSDDQDWKGWATKLSPAYSAPVATGTGAGSGTNTLQVCTWCEGPLATMQADGTLEAKMKEGQKGADIKGLHEHLTRLGFGVELQNNKGKAPKASTDVDKDTWGHFTTRAVKLFAGHPRVAIEIESVITSEGKKLTSALADKLREWCRNSTVSPQHYWEYPALHLAGGELDAFGADHEDTPEKQAALHDFVKQIQDDLAKTGFGVHDDALCEIGKAHQPTGDYKVIADDKPDKKLADTKHLVKRFQQQARWLWRMQSDGTHLADAKDTDSSYFGGSADGVMNAATAAVLHHWATHDLHMVIKKFKLVNLDWPPGSGTAITIDKSSTAAKLREDAHAAWLVAATAIHAGGGTLAGPYSSSPRGWKHGKMTDPHNANSPYSTHYSALAVDIGQHLVGSDGGVSDRHRHLREEDGTKFRLWCWILPQPPAPADPKDDKANAVTQYRNRNIRADHTQGSSASAVRHAAKPSDPAPLYAVTDTTNPAGTDKVRVTVKEGWYLDLTALLEVNGMMRINRHSDWVTKEKAWEWWHYQFAPLPPYPGGGELRFGDLLQVFGIHEHRLRNVDDGWPTHADLEHLAR
jgi:hypothetical protein